MRQRADHQRVPGGQQLVVARRAHAPRTRGEQFGARRLDAGRRPAPGRCAGPARHPASGTATRRFHAACSKFGGRSSPQCRAATAYSSASSSASTSSHGPDVELALLVLAVGVETRAERAFGRAHFGQGPCDDVARRIREQCLTGRTPGVCVQRKQQRVVVEHFLEMRDRPCRHRRCSGRSRRRAGRECRLPPCGRASRATISRARASPVAAYRRRQRSRSVVCGNLGASPKPPCTGSNARDSAASGACMRHPPAARHRPRAGAGLASANACRRLRILFRDRPALFAIGRGDARQQVGETRHAVARRSWENRCRRKTVPAPASGTSSAASRRCAASARRARPGRSGRDRVALRDRL